MLCCHVAKVMTQLGIREIPERYILKRWTWDAEEVFGEVIRLQRIYNFLCSMLILCQLLHVFPLLYSIFIRFPGLTY